jgi:hypothetical protein
MAKKPGRPPKSASSRDRTKIRAQAIKALERPGRRITAEILVQAARSPSHPLHGDFDWNDTRAAHRYRLDQARSLIASVRVIIETSTRRLAAPCYIRDVTMAPGPGYVATARLRSEREAAEESLVAEMVRLQAQLERCREISSALDLEEAFDAMLQTAIELRSRIRRGRPAEAEAARASV